MAINDKLKHARSLAGLSGSQVCDRSGVGVSSISDFENGKREPSLSQLQRLASVYHRPISYFLDDQLEVRQPAVLWRERPDLDAWKIEAKFLGLCQQYRNLEMWCNDIVESCLVPVSVDASKLDFKRAKALAKDVRDHLQLGDRPGTSLLRVLEEVCGVKVFHDHFTPTGTAASTKSETFGTAVLLNAANARWRRNFDLAHELFHLLTWEVFRHSGEDSSVVASDQEEKLANCFASNVLMPEEVLRIAVEQHLVDSKGTMPVDAVFTVARQFDVSVEALMWQIHFVFRSKADSQSTREQIDQLKAFAPLFEERIADEPLMRPLRYRALAAKALRMGELSIGRYAEYMGMTRQDAMRKAEQEIPDCEEVQVTSA